MTIPRFPVALSYFSICEALRRRPDGVFGFSSIGRPDGLSTSGTTFLPVSGSIRSCGSDLQPGRFLFFSLTSSFNLESGGPSGDPGLWMQPDSGRRPAIAAFSAESVSWVSIRRTSAEFGNSTAALCEREHQIVPAIEGIISLRKRLMRFSSSEACFSSAGASTGKTSCSPDPIRTALTQSSIRSE